MKKIKFGNELWLDWDEDTRIVVKPRFGVKPYFKRKDERGCSYDSRRGEMGIVVVGFGFPFFQVTVICHFIEAGNKFSSHNQI